jgi:hypothetical protein
MIFEILTAVTIRFKYFGMLRPVDWQMVTDLSKACSVFNFSVKQPTRVTQDYFELPDAEQDGDTIFLNAGTYFSVDME